MPLRYAAARYAQLRLQRQMLILMLLLPLLMPALPPPPFIAAAMSCRAALIDDATAQTRHIRHR